MPPTYDRKALIKGLPTKTQLEGTALGDALVAGDQGRAARRWGRASRASPHPPASILLVSDGGSNTGRVTPETAAQQAKKRGIPISTVALGTASGVVRQNIPTGKGKQTFPLVQQVPVDPKVLKQVASDSGGHFYAAPSASKLDSRLQGARLAARVQQAVP